MSASRVKELLQTQSVALGELSAAATPEAELKALRAENARLKEQILKLERAADADPLLPVYNRRAFVREIKRAQTVQNRYDIPSTVIYFDLDGFKAVNDIHGHSVGDALLKAVSKTLKSGVRQCDMVARLGGDEFGVLLFKTDETLAQAKASVLALRIANTFIESGNEAINVKVSWGVSACDYSEDAEKVISRADHAMYDDKTKAA